MILRLIACVFLVVQILYTATMLADIESVVKDWKDTMADAGDSKKPHPKTKPKHLAEKGTEA